ncbi:MAG: peptide-methionine (S)-S-oxide reductase MsrA [Candidatus Omnitrophota bacterium]
MRYLAVLLIFLGVFMANADAAVLKKAVFAGGCFWCMQPPYDKIPGVVSTTVGYTGGTVVNPTYEQVSSGTTGHFEAIEVVYDSSKTSYRELLRVFWRSIDPTDDGGQFADQGSQYEPAIFFADEAQRLEAEASKKEIGASGRFKKPIVTRILPAKVFYPAEGYHQKYYQKNSPHYNAYKVGSGRADFLHQAWPDAAP